MPTIKPHKWLKEDFLSTGSSKTCTVCGVTCTTGTIFNAGGSGTLYTYTDASNKPLESFVPLDECPTFVGQNLAGPIAATKQGVTKVTHRVDKVEDKVESIEDRVARLEGENLTLRQEQQRLQSELDSKTVDLTAFVRWLAEQVANVNAGSGERIVLPEALQPMLPTTVTRKLEQVEIEDAEFVPIPTRRSKGKG